MIDKKRKPEDVSRSFNQAMQEAGELYVREHYKAPELDADLLKKFKQKRKKNIYKRTMQIAALFMVIIVGGVSIGIWTNADGAYGGKKFIRKYVNVFSPLDIEQEVIEDGRLVETAVITDEKKIKDAQDFAEQLYMLEYIPDGYSFVSLKISKDDDFIGQDYLYRKGKKEFMVSANINKSGVDANLTVSGKVHKSPVTGEEMYVDTYEGGEYSVARIGDDVDCFVGGTGDVEEGIKILENFKILEKSRQNVR